MSAAKLLKRMAEEFLAAARRAKGLSLRSKSLF
jgi:hypothetical protein